jgi:hypothetical protein
MAAERRATARRGGRAWFVAATPLLAASVLTACASGPSPAPSAVAATTPVGMSPAPAPTPTPTVSPSASTSPLDRTAVPARTSGTLGPTSMPLAAALGPRWTSRVDPGSAEDGYTGNGTSVVARDPGDVMAALLPLGCASDAVYATALPVPAHALEADYAYRPTGAHASGLVLQFRDAAVARAFVRIYTAALRACRSGSTVVTVQPSPGPGLFLSTQVDRVEHDTWRELVAPAGRVVRLLAVEGSRTPLRPWAAIAADLPAAA